MISYAVFCLKKKNDLNVAKMTIEEANVSVSCDAKTNWNVGVIADIPILESLYVQTVLYLQKQGKKE